MLEGLWIVRFGGTGFESFDLQGGVAVIESCRLFGGDSGYFYVADVQPDGQGTWSVKGSIKRHDPNIESVFGDLDHVPLNGIFQSFEPDELGRPRLSGKFAGPSGTTLHLPHRPSSISRESSDL